MATISVVKTAEDGFVGRLNLPTFSALLLV
jgi:hypothetical protein